jgi:glycosyltransferase involved in cell wall biosynthesis
LACSETYSEALFSVISINSHASGSPNPGRRLEVAEPTGSAKTVSMPAPARPSVCFVAPNAYGALADGTDVSHVGGAERQQVLLSEELVRRGYRVSFVVFDHGQPDGETLRGVRIFKCYRADRGVRGLRFFHPRLTGLWNAMKRADADVYYQRGAESETGLVGHWCRRHGRGFIFAVAHDTNCMRVTPLITRFERLLFHHGLRHADAIITQTLKQQHMLREAFGLASTLCRSCPTWPPDLVGAAEPREDDQLADRILWVGRLSEEKRPEWLIRLATDLPECRFDVVGQCNTRSKYGRTLAARIEILPNVRWRGYVEHSRMRALYQKARVLLCTSASEGFPNVFLEAWSCGKPVLTSVDPDDVVATFQLGQVARDYGAMRECLVSLSAQRAWWEAAGLRGQAYVREHHNAVTSVDALEGVVAHCYASARARRSRVPTSADGGLARL